jgi:hypothetical protein
VADTTKNETTKNEQGSAEVPAVPGLHLSPLDRQRQQRQLRDYRKMSFDDLARQAQNGEVAVLDAAEAGVGFKLLEGARDKEKLVGVPLMVLPGWQVTKSNKFGGYFTSAYIKTRTPIDSLGGYQDFILNDGSTGIARQLADLRKATDEARAAAVAAGQPDPGEPAIMCRRGLKKSTYTVSDDLIDEKTGEVVIDSVTRRPVQVPRVDPITGQPVGEGTTFYLDTAV